MLKVLMLRDLRYARGVGEQVKPESEPGDMALLASLRGDGPFPRDPGRGAERSRDAAIMAGNGFGGAGKGRGDRQEGEELPRTERVDVPSARRSTDRGGKIQRHKCNPRRGASCGKDGPGERSNDADPLGRGEQGKSAACPWHHFTKITC